METAGKWRLNNFMMEFPLQTKDWWDRIYQKKSKQNERYLMVFMIDPSISTGCYWRYWCSRMDPTENGREDSQETRFTNDILWLFLWVKTIDSSGKPNEGYPRDGWYNLRLRAIFSMLGKSSLETDSFWSFIDYSLA